MSDCLPVPKPQRPGCASSLPGTVVDDILAMVEHRDRVTDVVAVDR